MEVILTTAVAVRIFYRVYYEETKTQTKERTAAETAPENICDVSKAKVIENVNDNLMPKTILQYGARWDAAIHPAQLELSCIKLLGNWESNTGRKCGNGLPYHVKAFMKLAWPDMEHHRWSDLLIEEFLKSPGRTACFGPSSSGKSFVFSRCALTMFYARPKGTTVMISSTTRDALTRRIWDYVVSSDKSARKIFPWLAGSLIESKLMLLADPSTEEGRSFKDGIIGVPCKVSGQWKGMDSYIGAKNEVMILVCDECFTPDTFIDTPKGRVKISNIEIGDKVLNVTGTGTVIGVRRSIPEALIEVITCDGRKMTCTPNHPFFTQKGWKKACELNQSHFILAVNEAMRVMRSASLEEETSFLREQLRKEMVAPATRGQVQIEAEEGTSKMRMVREASGVKHDQILQSELQRLRLTRETGLRKEAVGEVCSKNEGSSREEPCVESHAFGAHEKPQPDGSESYGGKGSIKTHRDWTSAEVSRGERNRTNGIGTNSHGSISKGDQQLSSQNRKEEWEWLSNRLQGGFGVSGNKTSRRGGRIIAQQSHPKRSGSKEGNLAVGAWVESVKILESPYKNGDGIGDLGTTVYNLEISGHPSYSVSGFLVHNCQFMPMGFLDALANLESNENMYAALMGNLPDIHNPLGSAAEPKGGWDALPDTEKTRVFPTKWKNGRCVQLIGMDSPNLDYPEGEEPFKNLIGRRYIEQCAQNYGRESDKFNMFASGKIPRASMSRTVFTKSMCQKFGATGTVTWGHKPVVRGYCLDPAYSGVGGDRTPGGPFIFGIDNTNRWRFWLGPRKIFIGSSSPKMSHCDAIALQTKEECEAHGIPPEHVFFDGTGRSELTSSFARLWSAKVVPIEFGGPATERPSFTGERWMDGENAGDTKICRDVFDRFVTELWFAIRHCIIADQMRGLDEEVIEEGCQRKWELIRGNKYCIETKDDMKERGLRSPDLADQLAVGLEGARRLGFPLGKHNPPNRRRGNPWLDGMREQEWADIQKDELEVA